MSDGYTAIPSAEIARRLDEARSGISADISSLRLSKLAEVVLGGGYGRGEGGVRHTEQGDRLYNDLDLFAFSRGADRRERRELGERLKTISAHWEKELGVAVDFSPVKNLDSLPRVGATLMYQELRRGWRPVWGEPEFEKYLPELDARELPVSEAIRLLLNRGMGLLFAGNRLRETDVDADFIMRNMYKALSGSGDALLIAAGEYRWSGFERIEAFREYAIDNELSSDFAENYASAFRYKIEPDPRLPEDPWRMWHRCRSVWLEAVRRIAGMPQDAPSSIVTSGLCEAAKKERSFRNFLRWTLRRGGWRAPVEAFDAPVVTTAAMLYRLLADAKSCPECPQGLYRRWQIFN